MFDQFLYIYKLHNIMTKISRSKIKRKCSSVLKQKHICKGKYSKNPKMSLFNKNSKQEENDQNKFH